MLFSINILRFYILCSYLALIDQWQKMLLLLMPISKTQIKLTKKLRCERMCCFWYCFLKNCSVIKVVTTIEKYSICHFVFSIDRREEDYELTNTYVTNISIQEWTKRNWWKTAFKKFNGICLPFTSFTWSILEYYVHSNTRMADNIGKLETVFIFRPQYNFKNTDSVNVITKKIVSELSKSFS